MDLRRPTIRQKEIEITLGSIQLEEAFRASPDPSQVREDLREAILAIRRAAKQMDELGCPWYKGIS